MKEKIRSYEQHLNAVPMEAPVSGIYWKEPELYEFREGLTTESALAAIERHSEALCSNLGTLAAESTPSGKIYGVYSAIPEVLANKTRAFVVLEISE